MALSWREAIERVLRESDRPLHYGEISEQVLSRGYYKTDGATPAATVNAQITASIKHDADKSPFVKVGKGIYALKVDGTTPQMGAGSVATGPDTSTPTSLKPKLGAAPVADDDPDGTESVIRSFGMYWLRDLVIWQSETSMFGKQQAASKAVDFGGQRGIYILYDQHTVVYVGRTIDRPLGKRLFEHTHDRLGSRWNRFSWFGLLDVADDGSLVDSPIKVSIPSLIATLEALLIESLEPPQNRRRGDDFSVIEYIQDVDPEIKERELRNTLRAIEEKLRGRT